MTRLGLAFAAGLLSPVNPCGIAMLPAFLGFYLGRADSPERDWRPRLWSGFTVGGSVSLGFVGVYAGVGLLVSAGLRWVMRAAPWTAVVLGAVFIALGVGAVLGRHARLALGRPLHPGRGRTRASMVVFGVAYALASVSCTLALLLALVGQGLAGSTVLGLFAVFAAFGLGAATLITGLTVSAALAGGVADRVRQALPAVQRLAGALLLLAGLYLVVYWLPVAMGGHPGRSIAAFSEDLSAWIAAFLDGQWRTFVLVAVGLGLGAALLALRSARTRSVRGADRTADPVRLVVGVNRMWTGREPAVVGVNRNWRADRYSE